VDRSAEDLAERVDQLALATQALWELAAERLHISDAELAAKIEEVDLRDGKADGRIRAGLTCTVCNRRHRHCLYCGADLDSKVFP